MKGLASSTKILASGERRTYYYAWRGGPRMEAEYGTVEFAAEYERLVRDRGTLTKGSIAWLIHTFQQSSEWQSMKPRTQSDHLLMFRTIKDDFGDVTLAKAQAKGSRSLFKLWRDEIGKRSPKTADKAMSSLSKLFTWAVDQEEMTRNPVLGTGKLYKGNRADIVWKPHQIASFRSMASPVLRLGLLLALHTGQRQGDLLNLKWSDYDGSHIRLTQSKTGKRVSILCVDALRKTLDDMPRVSNFIMTNTRGIPWTANGFQASWRKASRKAGIQVETFHDLRGTFVVNGMKAGLTLEQIATVTGHSLADLRTLERHYMGHDDETADNVILMMERNKK